MSAPEEKPPVRWIWVKIREVREQDVAFQVPMDLSPEEARAHALAQAKARPPKDKLAPGARHLWEYEVKPS